MKRDLALLLGLLCTACNPIVGTWSGTEYCDGPGESYCTTFPFELQEGRTAKFSLIVAGDLTGEKVYFVEDSEDNETSNERITTPAKVNEEAEGTYTITLFEEEERVLACTIEESILDCTGTDIGMTLEKESWF